MKNIFRSLLYSAMVLVAGFAASCTENEEGTGGYQGIPTIKVTPASLNVALAGGTTEQVVIETPAEWTLDIDTEGVIASAFSGNGDAVITFEVPAAEAMRTIKATFTATGYVSGYPITKKASVSISQSDSDIPPVDGSFVYYEDGGESVSKVDGYWPYVDAYTGWNPQGGEGFDQSGVTYTGQNASVRNSGKSWAPVGATYATDAPYAYLQAKDGVEFIIHNIKIKSGVKNYTFSFTAHNQYANEIASPYTPAPVSPLKSGENLTVEVSVDGTNFGAITYSTMADGNWEYAIAPFTLPADADKLFVRFSNYKADTTTPLPSTAYQYQAALRFDDFRLVEGGNGPVVDFNNAIGGGSTGGGDVPTEGVKATVAEFLAAAEDGTTYYDLTGVITNVANTTYGNFDLTDETGTVYIYGLCSPTGEQKYWAASGAKKGDTITVRTLRTSYNNTPQGKDAIFISLVPGEGGDEPTPEPAEGAYASDVPFVCAADDSDNCCYGHKDTNIGGSAVTGFKLGTGSKTGYFKSGAVGVDGDKYLNFYAVAWKGKSATLYMRVNGGETTSFKLNAHVGATGNPPYLSLTAESSDHYSVKLDGLTTSSTIEFSTDASFSAVANDTSGRAIVFGMKLTDEPLGTDNPGGTTPEPEPDPTPGETKTIAQILAAGSGASLSGTIEGVVISNMDLNNLTSKKGLYVQDETGALQFYLAANHELAFGTKVRIDLSGTTLGDYNGAVQISSLALDKITTVSTGNTVEPKVVTIADFLANKYEGQYVAIEGVQVSSSDLTKTWVMGGAHTSINMEDANGNKFVVFSSKYATYGAETVAQGSGTIKGIASINKGAMQIIFAQATDYASLTGARFDGTVTPDPTPTPGDAKTLPYAESFTTSQGDFTINNVTLGTLSYVWQHSTYNSDGYMKASAFMNNAAVAAESWLVSPAISLAGATSPVVTFTHAHKFAGTPSEELTLWVSANDGAWEQVTIPTYSDNNSWTFVESGEISLAKYVGSTVKVAFKYVSTASNAGTWEVKNFSVAEASGAVTPDPTPDPEPGDNYTSDTAFIQSVDESSNAVYTLGDSTINGASCSGFKLGTSSKIGTFTSKPVSVAGEKTLEFYGFAWKGKSAKLYIKVENGGSASVSEVSLAANAGATGNPPFTITATDSDKYTVTLTGLTENSTIVFSTGSSFVAGTADSTGNCRAIVAGVHIK